jgi:hypothetical protein
MRYRWVALLFLLLAGSPSAVAAQEQSKTAEVTVCLVQQDQDGERHMVGAVSVLLLEGKSSTFLSGVNDIRVTVKARAKGKVKILVEGRDLEGHPLFAPRQRTLGPRERLTMAFDSYIVEVRVRVSGED